MFLRCAKLSWSHCQTVPDVIESQMSGRRRATRLARLASSAANTTASAYLYAPGASSAIPRIDGLRIIPRCIKA
jgi:hypothetical protein